MLTNDLSDLSVSMRGEIDYERERENPVRWRMKNTTTAKEVASQSHHFFSTLAPLPPPLSRLPQVILVLDDDGRYSERVISLPDRRTEYKSEREALEGSQ